jgi:hypothetical protein
MAGILSSYLDASRAAKAIAVSVLILPGMVPAARAQNFDPQFGWSTVWTDWGRILSFSTGWAQDTVAVFHSGSFKNSVRTVPDIGGQGARRLTCTVVDGGYATDPADPGHKLHHAAIIAAYLHNKQARFLLQGCAFDKPRIISIDVKD